MVNRYAFAGLYLAACVIVCGHVNAAGIPSFRESLAGIAAVVVIVGDIAPEMKSLGLDPDVIKTDTELRLRRSGIKIDEEGWDIPTLYISVQPADREYFHYYSVEVFFFQRGTLFSNKKVMYVITWNQGGLGGGGGKITTDTIRSVREFVGDFVDKFINDFLAANPK